jgi:hypothetical protein
MICKRKKVSEQRRKSKEKSQLRMYVFGQDLQGRLTVNE